MEINQASIGKLEQIVCRSDEHEQDRAYTCNFCKRGFSNAQALGGHMNIHRKDRAKLRQITEDERLQSLDMEKKNPLIHLDHQPFAEKLCQLKSNEDKDCTLKNACSPPGKDKFRDSHSGASQKELDLELRLGPEPHKTSASGSSSRDKFF